jgi:hypothetical protein
VSQDNVIKLAQPEEFSDALTAVLRQGARSLLTRAVEAEIANFLETHAAFSSSDQRRRRLTPIKISTRTGVYPILRTSLRSYLRRPTKTDKAVEIGCIPCSGTAPRCSSCRNASIAPSSRSGLAMNRSRPRRCTSTPTSS